MLLTDQDRKLHASFAPRWARLRSWCAVYAPEIDVSSVWSRWLDVDRGLLSDPEAVARCHRDLAAAEAQAAARGQRTAGGPGEGVDVTAADAQRLKEIVGAEGTVRAGVAASGEADAPDTTAAAAQKLREATQGFKADAQAGCKAAGLPAYVCEGRAPGLQDVPAWVWVAAAGTVGLLGLAAYAAWSAREVVVPLGLAAYAPGALPAYASARQMNALTSDCGVTARELDALIELAQNVEFVRHSKKRSVAAGLEETERLFEKELAAMKERL
jgi:hypothetical protein